MAFFGPLVRLNHSKLYGLIEAQGPNSQPKWQILRALGLSKLGPLIGFIGDPQLNQLVTQLNQLALIGLKPILVGLILKFSHFSIKKASEPLSLWPFTYRNLLVSQLNQLV